MRISSIASVCLYFLLVLFVPGFAAAGEKLDKSLAVTAPDDSVFWYDVRHLNVEGRGWTDTKEFYDRLPARAESIVREPVWNLSRHSAGMCVRFVTDAPVIYARWSLRSENLDMPHMPATGVSGLDLYVKTGDGTWRWLANGRPVETTNRIQLISGIPPGEREYLLYLPLYNGVTSVEIGVEKNIDIAKADDYPDRRKPILFYGTSITHGACASRPGMCYSALLGRWLNYPVINLGFSGNGRMESEMAELFAELDPSVYVLDCLPNITGDQVMERTEPFVRILRKAHPDTPIVLVEDRTYPNSFLIPGPRIRNVESRAALRKAYDRMTAAGVKNLYYLPGDKQIGEDGEGTVDNSHPNDLGFVRQSETFMTVLEPILYGTNKSTHSAKEWQRSNPDVAVYLPRGINDGDNEHFLVFDAPKSKELLGMWTQSSVEGRGDNRIVLSRSMDGEMWSDPTVITGRGPGRIKELQASWGFPIVADTGRIYCFYTKEIEKNDLRQSSGTMGCMYSDDNGHTWIEGADITMPRNRYDNPDPSYPKNWIVFQKPIDDGRGHYIAGYTHVTSPSVREKPSPNWTDIDSRCAFMRFDNIKGGPDPSDLKISWLPTDNEGIEVPHKIYPDISVCQEPALVLLPDGKLFVVMRTMTGYIWYSVSEDGGATWQKPEVLLYRDNGEKVPNPMAPCPIYSLPDGKFLLLFYNNDGKRGNYDQFKKIWDNGNQLNYLRNPAFIAVGEFRPNAHQPVWFSKPKQILDTQGVTFGPKGTASIATYPSVTNRNGKSMLWYPDRKHYLLGLHLRDDLLGDMTVPK
ncbi:MAG: exo-alpha-sialidase [Candidatus Latescibacteria bacterium]|nr:exo-alpha-sialidase [Candidatus Latescibacterota bacterium]